jgi:hypothetical protein
MVARPDSEHSLMERQIQGVRRATNETNVRRRSGLSGADPSTARIREQP